MQKDEQGTHGSGLTHGSTGAFQYKWAHLEARDRKFYTAAPPDTQKALIFGEYARMVVGFLQARTGVRSCLEIGAGRGTCSLYLAKHGIACTLLDYSPDAVALARDNFRSEDQAARFVVGDALHLPFAEAGFDAVISLGLLEHFSDVVPPLTEMAAVLRPKGVLVSLNIPQRWFNANSVAMPYNFLARQVRRIVRPLRTMQNLKRHGRVKVFRNRLGPDGYRKAAAQAGFADVRSISVNPIPTFEPVPAVADRLLARLYTRWLQHRGRRGDEGFEAAAWWSRAHFLVGTK